MNITNNNNDNNNNRGVPQAGLHQDRECLISHHRPQKGYAKRGSKKRLLLLSDLEVT